MSRIGSFLGARARGRRGRSIHSMQNTGRLPSQRTNIRMPLWSENSQCLPTRCLTGLGFHRGGHRKFQWMNHGFVPYCTEPLALEDRPKQERPHCTFSASAIWASLHRSKTLQVECFACAAQQMRALRPWQKHHNPSGPGWPSPTYTCAYVTCRLYLPRPTAILRPHINPNES